MKLSVQVLLTLVSAVMVPLCFPPFGWWPLVIVSLAALFAVVKTTPPRRAFYLGGLHGVLGFGLALHWFFAVIGMAAVPLFCILAVFTALFCLLCNFLARHLQSSYMLIFAAATLWTGIEFYRCELFFLRFPWITPGTALGPTYLSPILGVYAGSFIVASASMALISRRTVPVGVLLSAVILSLGIFRPGEVAPRREQQEAVEITVVQGEECRLQDYVELTRQAENPDADLIIWPEHALPYDVRKRKKDLAVLTDLCAEAGCVLVIGTKTDMGPGQKSWRNTALVLDEDGVIGEYYKARPVHFFNDGIPGRSFEPVQTDLGIFGTPICFDCDYSMVTRRMAQRGATFFTAPSFDAESWGRIQHLQHAALFRLRAAETGRWLTTAASSGVSQVIDPNGNMHKRLPLMEKGTLSYDIAPRTGHTLFTKAGWLFPWAAMVAAGIILLYVVSRKMLTGGKIDSQGDTQGTDGSAEQSDGSSSK